MANRSKAFAAGSRRVGALDWRGQLDPFTDFMDEAACHHATRAMSPLRDWLHATASGVVLADALVFAVPVRISGPYFDMVEGGKPAVLAPCTDETGLIIDLAAIDPDRGTFATFLGEGFALGATAATAECLDEGGRALVHADLSSWLRAECCGLLPLDWKETAIFLHWMRVAGVVAGNVRDGSLIEKRLALRAPRVFVEAESVCV